MGFLNTIFNAAVEKGEELRALKDEYSCYDDERLIRIADDRYSGTTKIIVASSVLKDRYKGYSDEELWGVYRNSSGVKKRVSCSILKERGYDH